MMDQTLKELEQKIKESSTLPDDKKAEMLGILGGLKTEVRELAKTRREEAESITGFTKLSTYEAMRRKRNPDLLDLSLQGLTSSVKEFQATHPKLAAAVNSIATMLANMGI